MVKTQTMFGQLYKRLALLAKEPIQQLFDQLERFVSSSADGMGGDPADVSDAVNGFFDDLFPRLYGQSPRSVQEPPLPADSVGQRLPQDYVDCLRHAQSELRPFGEIPRRLANSLARSLDAVRSLLSALDLGARVLNATDHVELNSQCRDALLRATYCAQCRALKRQQPIVVGSGGQVCSGLCSNVARGCLAAVADVDQPWNEWVDAMERLAAALLNKAGAAVADLGPHDILSSVDSRLSEAVLYALENGPLLEKKVSFFFLCVFFFYFDWVATLPRQRMQMVARVPGNDQSKGMPVLFFERWTVSNARPLAVDIAYTFCVCKTNYFILFFFFCYRSDYFSDCLPKRMAEDREGGLDITL